MISNLSCQCGTDFENLKHYFFECPQYLNIITSLFNNINWLPTDCNVDLKLLTFGNNKFTYLQIVSLSC